MFRGTSCAPPAVVRGVAALLCLGLAAGCERSNTLAGAGVSLAPPAGWSPVPASTWPVPGTPLAAWSGPGGASLVVYRSLPVPGGKAEALASELANRLGNLPGLRVVSSGTEAVGGVDAARVEAVAPGTGAAFAPSGTGTPLAADGRPLRPTRRVVIRIPREPDTLSLVWHAPDDRADALAAQVRETLTTLKVDRGRLAVSSY